MGSMCWKSRNSGHSGCFTIPALYTVNKKHGKIAFLPALVNNMVRLCFPLFPPVIPDSGKSG